MGSNAYKIKNLETHIVVVEGELLLDQLYSFAQELASVIGSPAMGVDFSNVIIVNNLVGSQEDVAFYLKDYFEGANNEQLLMALRMLSNLDSCRYFIIRDGSVLSADCKSLFHFPPVEDVVVPLSVEYIGHNAFNMREEMKSLTLNEGLRRIGNLAFDSCEGLRELVLPDSVESVGEYAFCCSELVKVRLSENMTKIASGCFCYCPIEEIFIPHSIRTIEEFSLFGFCYGRVTIPEGVEEIKSAAFNGLEAISLPSTLKRIDADFFYEDGIEETTPHIEIHPSNSLFYSENGMLYYRMSHLPAVHEIM